MNSKIEALVREGNLSHQEIAKETGSTEYWVGVIAEDMHRIRAVSIRMTLAEGPVSIAGKSVTVGTWKEADQELGFWKKKITGWSKVDFVVLFGGGLLYDSYGVFRIHPDEKASLAEHIREYNEFCANPPAELAELYPQERRDLCRRFLSTYSLIDYT